MLKSYIFKFKRLYSSTDDSWLTEFSADWWFDFFVVSDDKTPNRTSFHFPCSFPLTLYFSRGFKFLFYAARILLLLYTIEKICFRISVEMSNWKSFPVCWMFIKGGENAVGGRTFFPLLTKWRNSTSDNSSGDEWWFYDWNVDSLIIPVRNFCH